MKTTREVLPVTTDLLAFSLSHRFIHALCRLKQSNYRNGVLVCLPQRFNDAEHARSCELHSKLWTVPTIRSYVRKSVLWKSTRVAFHCILILSYETSITRSSWLQLRVGKHF